MARALHLAAAMRVPILVVIGLAVPQVGCLGSDCTETRLRAFEVALPADPSLQFHLDRCALDEETCIDVCALVMLRENVPSGPVLSCGVTVEETKVVLLASFEVFNSGGFLSSCGFEGDDIGPPPPR